MLYQSQTNEDVLDAPFYGDRGQKLEEKTKSSGFRRFAGWTVGLLVAIMGIGGGFILVPAMIYLLGMPIGLVAGTSLFQIIFTTGITTFLQAITTHAVDVVLAAVLIVGGVIGAQVGTRLSHLLKPEYSRLAHASIVLAVAVKLAYDLFTRPENLFSVVTMGN